MFLNRKKAPRPSAKASHDASKASHDASKASPDPSGPEKIPEKPFASRMKNVLAGVPQKEVILDPDNPNLIMERKRDA